MKVWTVANQKGGVGKTTSAVSLAGLLSLYGRKSLLIDMDPHGSMSTYFGYDPDQIETGVYSLFLRAVEGQTCPLEEIISSTKFRHIDLIAASSAMVSLDRQFSSRSGMGLVVKHALAVWGDKYDYVILDCPPMMGISMVNALAACERVIVPVQTEFLAIKGLERLQHTLSMIGRNNKPALAYTIVPTMYDKRTRASLDSLKYLRDHFSENLFPSFIPVDTLFRDASRDLIPLTIQRPSSRGSLAYDRLLTYLNKQDEQQTDWKQSA